MPKYLAAALVHVFTALGAACALMATLAVFRHEWPAMFAWLGVALIIDAVDGPLARAAHVKTMLPRFSGDRLDLIIDYLTYVFIPALALIEAGFLPGRTGQLLAALIVMSSLFHFSDMQSKADDHSFVGFPSIWNVVALYLFAFAASPVVSAAVTVACIVLTFVPLKWPHPVRVRALRPVTALMCAIWAAAALWTVARGFPAETGAKVALAACGLYALALCLWRGFSRNQPP